MRRCFTMSRHRRSLQSPSGVGTGHGLSPVSDGRKGASMNTHKLRSSGYNPMGFNRRPHLCGLVVGEIDDYGTRDTNYCGVSWRVRRSPGRHRTDRPELCGDVSNHCSGGLFTTLDTGTGCAIRFDDHLLHHLRYRRSLGSHRRISRFRKHRQRWCCLGLRRDQHLSQLDLFPGVRLLSLARVRRQPFIQRRHAAATGFVSGDPGSNVGPAKTQRRGPRHPCRTGIRGRPRVRSCRAECLLGEENRRPVLPLVRGAAPRKPSPLP
jgi:hypothetical protein